jgi:hypothetical protein
MTVENDGLSPTESAAHEPEVGDPPPPADVQPLDGSTARKVAADDAAALQAELEATAPTAPTGNFVGDLFDDQAEH